MDERMAISVAQGLYAATPQEVRAYVEGLEARAKAGSAADRWELDAELTAIINERGSRGVAIQPGVIVGKRHVETARYRLRLLIERDLGGSYDRQARFPGLR